MIGHFLRIVSVFSALFVGVFGFFDAHAAVTFIPASHVSLTGSNTQVFFDVADEIYNSGTTIGAPVLETAIATFSGAFYLSGAGWVDFGVGTDRVKLDCGGQSLSALATPCTLSGVAYAEMIGDVTFDRRVLYDPLTGNLSGSAATYIGDYSFSGVFLPLLPVTFLEGDRIIADHTQSLTLSGGSRHSGPNIWQYHIWPSGGSDRLYLSLSNFDFSHAGIYRVEIIDPSGSITRIDGFEVRSATPSASLDADIATTVRAGYCSANPAACIDGASLSATALEVSTPVSPVRANGVDTYDYHMKLRDRYGNAVTTGDIKIDYTDSVREIQDGGFSPYMTTSPFMWPSLSTSDDLQNFLRNGTPTTGYISASLGDITYSIASIAPTSPTDTLVLSGVLYRDTLGSIIDMAPPGWKTPITFLPWYTTDLSPGPIVAGEFVDFTTAFASSSPVPPPTNLSAIYEISIGTNNPNSFRDFESNETISCAKYYGESSMGECEGWLPNGYDPVMISTIGGSFSGRYDIGSYDIDDPVMYSTYITYEVGGTRVLYPSLSGNLGVATPGAIRMKILGQQNIAMLAGVSLKNLSDFWNMLKKNSALLSRNRTDYTDVEYSVQSGNITVDGSEFVSGSPAKRTIVTLGGDITIVGNIASAEKSLALIALTSADGLGGNIRIDPSVTDIHASLIAEHAIYSSGPNQLYIKGSVVSHNTKSDTVCPYFVSPCMNADDYNLENLRREHIASPGTPASSPTALEHPTIPLIIEYDGGLMIDPPPMLTK